MLLKRGIRIVFFTFMILILSSCWNRNELNEISIATALGFDKNKDKYNVSVQLINSGEIAATKGTGHRMPVITLQLAYGHTIFESIRALTQITPRKIYTAHLRILIIGEDLAKEGIAKILDGISRDHELRTDFYIVVAKNASANAILRIISPLEKIPADKLFSSLEASERNWGVTSKVDLHQLVTDLVDKGKDPVLAGIHIKGNSILGKSKANLEDVSPLAVLEYQGLAVFRKDKLVGWLNSKESKGYNYIHGNIKSTIVTVACPKAGYLAVELIKTKKKVNGKIVNGHPEIEVNVQVEGNIGEVECKMNLGTNQAIDLIEDKVSMEIKETIEESIGKAKFYKSDIFGFGTAIHRANFKEWNQIKENWEQEFVNLPVHVTVSAKIRNTGSVVESLLERMGSS